MTYTLIPNIWYTITPETDCDIDTPNGISIHLPAGIQYFHFADSVSIDISGTATVTQNPPLFKPASASALGGGYIESDLNVGHGAADAVAAQCSLTPGADLDIGGTLEHDGSVVELEDQFAELDIAVSHPEYGGKLEVTDADGQTLYTFDTPAAPDDFASIVLTFAQGWELNGIEFALDKGDGDTLELAYSWEGDFSLNDFVEFLNSGAEGSLGDFAEARPWAAGIKITLKDPAFAGAAGNAVTYVYMAMSPFTNEDGETFSGGGENARDLLGLVEAMQDDDAPVEVEVNAGNDGVLLTSKVGGAAGAYNVVNAEGGGLWLGVDDTLAIAAPRTLADLAAAIEEDLTLMELASASVSDGKIVLTAPTTPTATQYNNMEYTATGCFGGGTVKQGSTTRGKNAVIQTAFKIYLNGAELDVEPAPVPTALTPTTAMRNGGVYTVEADINATGITLPANATARLWAYKDDGLLNVQWPSWKWLTEDGMPPNFDYFRQYRLEVERDNRATTAKVVDSYAVRAEYLHEPLTSSNRTDTGLRLYLVAAETSSDGRSYFSGSSAVHEALNGGGKYTVFYGERGNIGGDTEWKPQDVPTGEPYPAFGWYAITFCTARPITVHALTVRTKRHAGMKFYAVFEAWVNGGWVTLSASPAVDDSWRDNVLKPELEVEADKFRLLVVQPGNECFVGDIRIFEK